MTERDVDLVEAEWNLICPMEPLYADITALEPLYEQAVQVLDVVYGPDDNEPNVKEWIRGEARSAHRSGSGHSLLRRQLGHQPVQRAHWAERRTQGDGVRGGLIRGTPLHT